MANIKVTNELSNTIRSLRLQYSIKATDLAESISRSPAYITKLEKGEIQTIDESLFDSILKFLVKDAPNSDKLAEDIFATLERQYTPEEIDNLIWFSNYDTVYRQIPIPQDLIDEISSLLNAYKITREQLLTRINANEALTEEEKSDDSIKFNRWYKSAKDGVQSIKIKLEENALNNILDRIDKNAPYVFVFAILFYTKKIVQFGDVILLSDKENRELMQETTNVLTSYKFYSLVEKSKTISNAKTIEEFRALQTSFDRKNVEVINSILAAFKVLSELDITLANERFASFDANLKWDVGFMQKLFSMNFCQLGEISTTQKKNLLSEIEALLTKYINLPDVQKKIESY